MQEEEKKLLIREIFKSNNQTDSDNKYQRENKLLGREFLIDKIEKFDPKKERRVIAYISSLDISSAINIDDIAPLGGLLENIGKVNYLDLIIHSSGGDGNAAEKIVNIFRQFCKKEFRIIVPNIAKSAATIIALGSDEIVMGYTSELGPIDAQIPISVGGYLQRASAQSFIQKNKGILKDIQEAINNGTPYIGLLHQLSQSTMEPAFIEQCEKDIKFVQDLVKKWLPKYMLKKKYKEELNNGTFTQNELENKADSIAKKLTSTEEYPIHGKIIDADECEKLGLQVKKINVEDGYWKLIFELYLRADLFMKNFSRKDSMVSKIFMCKNQHLISYGVS